MLILILFTASSAGFLPQGEDSGNAELLSDIIVKNYSKLTFTRDILSLKKHDILFYKLIDCIKPRLLFIDIMMHMN